MPDNLTKLFKEHAQDGRGVKRPAERVSGFRSSLAARSLALCAELEALHYDARTIRGVAIVGMVSTLLRNTRKTGTPRPPRSTRSSPVRRHGFVPFALLRNTRKTVAVSIAQPKGRASFFLPWRRAAAPFALACIFMTGHVDAAAAAVEDNPLAIIDGGVERSEDAPYVPADFEFLPGDYLFFTFHISGFKIKANQTGEIRTLSLQYRITPQDLNGVALAGPVDGTISDEINKEDKTWTPKRRANFLLPSFVASGDYRVHVVVKDIYAGTEVSRDYRFKMGGTQIPPTSGIRADQFAFLRTADEAKPLDVPAYSPGDTVFARFLMVGFKTDQDNKYRLAYGIKVTRPDGKTFLDEPKAAQIAANSFYPAQFMPGDIQVTTPRDAMHGRYQMTVTVRDLIANQDFTFRETFSIE
jgi:hypothetical protein